MNERIKELAEQAGASMLHGGELSFFGNTSIEKFAELIVEECCKQLLTEDIRYDGYGYNQYGLHDKLREHFGVKK